MLLLVVALVRDPQAHDQLIASQLELPEVKEASVGGACGVRLKRLFELAHDGAQPPFKRGDLAA